ncbi:hypothetical protein FV242_08250 [Methylobacterium sp. WL64]|uniref:hypothetical protein n=1 Tax=Methylobacterium sp. WL64 TaxID=2603894 RepID=UPI0011CCA56A|nr:hypothetical protein [Methylobacterium sp. WL64]TXN04196.1 hypothetical protein FV242_08250 [Methylobacterium sp. WL64]
MASLDEFGPWATSIDACERRARCRTFRAIARMIAGPRTTALCDALACSENDPAHLERALVAFEGLASLDKRRILGSFHPVMMAPTPCAA